MLNKISFKGIRKLEKGDRGGRKGKVVVREIAKRGRRRH